MSTLSLDIAKMIDMLPENEQQFAYEVIKRLVLAWDPYFTKLTPEEELRISRAEASGYISDKEIDWAKIGKPDK
jgi:hypothetical protein